VEIVDVLGGEGLVAVGHGDLVQAVPLEGDRPGAQVDLLHDGIVDGGVARAAVSRHVFLHRVVDVEQGLRSVGADA